MYYLTKEDLLDLHTFAVMRYGGLLGISSQDRLQVVLNAPHQKMFGVELYPDMFSKAAAVTYLLIKNRPFLGGNEVTAFMALLYFLERNEAELRAPIDGDALFKLFHSLNHSEMDKDRLEYWLRDHVVVHVS